MASGAGRKKIVMVVTVGITVALLSLGLRRYVSSVPKGGIEIARLTKSVLPDGSADSLTLALGMKLAATRQFKHARAVFEAMLAKDPTNVSILNNLGYIAGEMGDATLAKHYLDTALQLSETCAECLNNLGALLQKEHKADEARLYFERATKASPEALDPKLNLAVLFETQSDWASALLWYRQAEPLVLDAEMKRWVQQRRQWMTEITESEIEPSRALAGDR